MPPAACGRAVTDEAVCLRVDHSGVFVTSFPCRVKTLQAAAPSAKDSSASTVMHVWLKPADTCTGCAHHVHRLKETSHDVMPDGQRYDLPTMRHSCLRAPDIEQSSWLEASTRENVQMRPTAGGIGHLQHTPGEVEGVLFIRGPLRHDSAALPSELWGTVGQECRASQGSQP